MGQTSTSARSPGSALNNAHHPAQRGRYPQLRVEIIARDELRFDLDELACQRLCQARKLQPFCAVDDERIGRQDIAVADLRIPFAMIEHEAAPDLARTHRIDRPNSNRGHGPTYRVTSGYARPMKFVDVTEARAARGVRLVVVGGVPSAWSEAAKGLFDAATQARARTMKTTAIVTSAPETITLGPMTSPPNAEPRSTASTGFT